MQDASSVQEESLLREPPPEDYIFALDIGTRDIIGIVGTTKNGKLHIQAVEVEEHTHRAMMDGQIENIEQVSFVARRVKEKLERRLGITLDRVCVAAAGRSLKTQRATFKLDLETPQIISDEIICKLEAGAVQSAEAEFDPGKDNQENAGYYLVGYSVVEYLLDNYPLSSLLDHKGQHLAVDVISTFLPQEVVNSLYTAMQKAGLEVASLTLEPIAAINATIPQNLRLLNLALVDIGAGTSDIAISKEGSVCAYTMATTAGDEITEILMRKFLVDFDMAETIKRSLVDEREITFSDILGFEHTISPEEVWETVKPARHALCLEIGEHILKANGGVAPSAVFLVGGGSKLPDLCGELAEILKMDANRVAIGGNYFSSSAVLPEDIDLTGPEYATPLGIAISTALNLINDSFSISLNGETAKLFRSGKLTALDVLMMNGYSYNQLISRSGQSVSFNINGEKRVVRGTHPVPAVLTINGTEAVLSTIVKAGDRINFTPTIPGKDAQPMLKDMVDYEQLGTVTFLDSQFVLGTHVLINDMPAEPQQILKSRDTVKTFRVELLNDLLELIGEEDTERRFLVNGRSAGKDYPLADGDVITYAETKPAAAIAQKPVYEAPAAPFAAPAVPAAAVPAAESADDAKGFSQEDFFPVMFSASQSAAGTPQKILKDIPIPQVPTQQPEPENFPYGCYNFLLNGEPLQLPKRADGQPYLMLDMLSRVNMDLSKPQGRIVLKINGKDAPYRCELADQDHIEIHWDK